MFSPPATPTLARIVAFSAGRYNALIGAGQAEQARAFMSAINQVNECQMGSRDAERDMLDWLSKPHADPSLRQACTLILETLARHAGDA